MKSITDTELLIKRNNRKFLIGCLTISIPIIIILISWILSMLFDSDQTEPSTLQDQLKLNSMVIVQQSLKYPDTAKFPGDWKIGENDNSYSVSSYVKAENDLGQKTNTQFYLRFNKSTNEIVYYKLGDDIIIDE